MTDLDMKITEAMHRIEELYYETDGRCYLSFSGGKDSTVILALIKMCEEIYTIPENAIPAVYGNTGIEMGVIVDFVRWIKQNYYSNVIEIRPAVSFDWVLKNKGYPLKSKLKSEYIGRWQSGNRSRTVIQNMIDGKTNTGKEAWKIKLSDKDMHMLHDDFPIKASKKCCDYLKKKPFHDYANANGMKGQMTGLRISEGGARELNASTRKLADSNHVCTSVDAKGFIKKAPLIDWTDEDIDTFIDRYNVPLSKAYTEYAFHRTGCMACPYSFKWLPHSLQYLHDHEPNRYKAAMHWLKDVYIAQNVELPFDREYERERERMWREVYEPMRQEMLRKYRPNSHLIKDGEQLTLFD